MKRSLWLVLLGAVTLLAAAPADAQRGRRTRIERPEITAAQSTNVLELIQSRRSSWLNRQHPSSFSNPAATELLVFVDGARLDGLQELRLVPAAEVDLVEFLSASQTEFRFGMGSPNGAIAVTTRGVVHNRLGENRQR